MATFVSISGPSSTGKTQLIDSLSTYSELSNAVFSSDLYTTVWNDLVKKNFFSEWKEINTDSEYLCLYILRVIDYYENYMEAHSNSDKLVILDGCWVDILVYSMLNLWYNRTIKDVQENIFYKINKYNERLSRVYFTCFDESKHVTPKYRSQYKMANMKLNRPLEIQFYKTFSNLKNSVSLPTTDITEESMFIIDDLRNLGHI